MSRSPDVVGDHCERNVVSVHSALAPGDARHSGVRSLFFVSYDFSSLRWNLRVETVVGRCQKSVAQ